MFTDIVGYTALMGSDEDKAFEVLRRNRKIHTESIEKFNGTLIKEMGDGILAQFYSAADSVQCAIEIQKLAMKDLDARIRIGIHLGDITQENNDVFGDGVNLASRLQSIADPGGIYISESVRNAIRSIKDFQSQYLGEVILKNVNYPFKTYYIKGKGLPVPCKERIEELTGVVKPESIVVLPFDNFTGNSELEYFVAGMHASLIGSIGKVSGMRVISKTTANAFKNTEKSIPEIASELGVNTVIEASVLSLDEKICLQVKLINASPEEKQLWIQDYIEDKRQILNLYSKLTRKITNAINVKLTPQENQLLTEERTVDEEAYDAYLKGRYHWKTLGKTNLDQALTYFKIAADKEPEWSSPFAGIAEVWIGKMQMGFTMPDKAIPQIYQNLNKALELDPNSSNSHYVNGLIKVWTEWNWEEGEQEFLRSLELNQNNPLSHNYYAHLLTCLQRREEAVKHANIAVELDPLDPLILALSAVTLLDAGNEKNALKLTKKAVSLEPDHYFANGIHEYASFYNSDYKGSIETLLKIYQLEDLYTQKNKNDFDLQWYSKTLKEILDILETKLIEGMMPPWDFASYAIRINKTEQALKWMEKGYEIHDPNMPYLRTRIIYSDQLKDNPRYIALLEKMRLPMPEE